MAAKPSLQKRLTAKVGPAPVWVWAVGLLAIGYIIYRYQAGKSTTSSSASTTAAPVTDTTAGTGGTVPPATDTTTSGDVAAATQDTQAQVANLNDSLLSQLQGFGGQIDALTQAVQSSSAFAGFAGDSGSGSLIPNSGTPATATQTPAAAPAVQHPASTTAHQANAIRYYTFKPGQAPRNRKGDEAPARGPRGTTLHFAPGRGYYYA